MSPKIYLSPLSFLQLTPGIAPFRVASIWLKKTTQCNLFYIMCLCRCNRVPHTHAHLDVALCSVEQTLVKQQTTNASQSSVDTLLIVV